MYKRQVITLTLAPSCSIMLLTTDGRKYSALSGFSLAARFKKSGKPSRTFCKKLRGNPQKFIETRTSVSYTHLNNVVQATHHAVKAVQRILIDRHAADCIPFHQPCQQPVFVRYALGVDINRTAVGRFPVLAFPAVCRPVPVLIHLIFAQTDDAQGQTVAVRSTERNGFLLYTSRCV